MTDLEGEGSATATAESAACPAVFAWEQSRGWGRRPARRSVVCQKPLGHSGTHYAAWGGAQKANQHHWNDDGSAADLGGWA